MAGFRVVSVSTHSKLEYSLNYLVYRTVDVVKRINLDEISTLIIQSPMVSITSALMIEIVRRKIKLIVCDEKANPCFEAVPYYGDTISVRRINEQLKWDESTKGFIWKIIVKEKILNQSKILKKYNKLDYEKLVDYSNKVVDHDINNCEGHAAKVYFNRVFYDGFTRDLPDNYNKYLNFGYSIILSQFNRYIVAKGYLTQLGIHHKNEFNQFNLSCDLMEPFRPIIDDLAHIVDEENYKDKMIDVLNIDVKINNQIQKLSNAINIYLTSIFNALNTGEINNIYFIESYEL